MANDFYNGTTQVVRQTKIRATAENSDRALIAAGFDKLPSEAALTQNRIAYAADTGSADAYAIVLPVTLVSYAAGLLVWADIANTNTGTSTLDVDALGVKTIKRIDGTNVEATDLTAGDIHGFVYDGVNFVMVSPVRTHMAGMASNLGADLIFSGDPSFTGDPTFTRITGSGDMAIDGNTFFVDASTNRCGFGIASPLGPVHVQSSVDEASIRANPVHATFSSSVMFMYPTRAASSAYSFLECRSGGGSGDLEFKLTGDGNGTCDGAWTGGGADYAEYFEWADGNPTGEDRRGFSVVLVGDKIRKANPRETPFGVISGNPSVVGDAAPFRWVGKYERDDFGAQILEDVEVPDGAASTMQAQRKLSPAFDPDSVYVPRKDRKEWDTVGLIGKLRLRKGQPVDPRWIKMRDVSATVEEWLVR